jgi:hypothetical protein
MQKKHFLSQSCLLQIALLITLILPKLCWSQNNIKNHLDSIFIGMLIRDGILLSSAQKECPAKNCTLHKYWDNKNAKRKILKEDEQLKNLLLNNYSPSALEEGQIINQNLYFQNRTLGFLGSQIIRNHSINSLKTAGLPILPVLTTPNELSIIDPNTSNYKLNFTTENSFEGNASISAAIKASTYISGKVSSFYEKDKEKLQVINIGVGDFKNQYAKIIEDMNSSDFKPKNFTPIYYIWTAYKTGDIQPGDECLNSFRGLCLSNQRLLNIKTNVQYTAEVEASGSVPFLSVSGNAKSDWSKKSSTNSQSNTYSLFMFSTPSLKTFPTVEEIKTLWNKLSKRATSKPIQSEKESIISYNGDLTLTATFGPIPSDEIAANIITIDTTYTFARIGRNNIIDDISLDLNNVKPIEDNYYTIPLVFHRNESFFKNAGSSCNCETEIPIRIYLNNPIGKDTLDAIYKPIKIKGEPKPLPYQNEQNPISHSSKLRGKYVYNCQVNIDPPSIGNFNLAMTGANKPQVKDVTSIKSGKSELKNKLIQSCVVASTGSPNSFKLTFSLDSSSFNDYFPTGSELDFVVQFKDRDQIGGQAFLKNLEVKIQLPDEIEQNKSKPNSLVSGTTSFNTNIDLLRSIDSSLAINESQTFQVYVDSVIKNKVFNSTKIIELLKGKTDLILAPDNNYIISMKYVNRENGGTIALKQDDLLIKPFQPNKIKL